MPGHGDAGKVALIPIPTLTLMPLWPGLWPASCFLWRFKHTYLLHLTSLQPYKVVLLASLFYRWGHCGTEMLNTFAPSHRHIGAQTGVQLGFNLSYCTICSPELILSLIIHILLLYHCPNVQAPSSLSQIEHPGGVAHCRWGPEACTVPGIRLRSLGQRVPVWPRSRCAGFEAIGTSL